MARIITGIEISKNGIRAVEISAQRKKFRILRFIREEVETDALSPDEQLALFISKHKIQKECLVTSVPGDMLITRELTVPFRERSKIDNIIQYEIEPLVPFPVQELDISYRILSQEKGKSHLLVYVLPRNILDQRSTLFEKAGLSLQLITVSSLASANTLFQIEETPDNGSMLHLHVSAMFCVLSVYEKGHLTHLQRLQWTHESFFQKIQEITQLDSIALSERLREISSSETFALLDALKSEPFELAPQIGKSLKTGLARSQGGVFKTLYVTGAPAALLLLPPLLETALSIRAEVPDPLPGFSHHLEKNAWKYGLHAPLGMALMEGGWDALQCSFRKKKFSLLSRFTKSKREIRYAAFILIFLVLASAADFFVTIQTKKHQYKQLEQESHRIFQETFPDAKNIVNELEQMKLKIKEVEKQNDIFRNLFGEKPSPLEILNEFSTHIPEEIDLTITELSIDEKSIRFMGWTDSFESVNQIEQELKKSDSLGIIKVNNAKISKDKETINFQIKIEFKKI